MKLEDKIQSVNITFLVIMVLHMGLELLAYFGLLDGISGNLALGIILPQLILIVPVICMLAKNKLNYAKEFRFKKIKISTVLLLILLAWLLNPLMTFLNALSLTFTNNALTGVVTGLYTNYPFLLSALLMAVIPAVVEESVFRGMLYGTYRKTNPWIAVIASGLLFGIAHGNLNQFIYTFALGCIFAFVTEATGSLLSTMIIHFVFNIGSVISVYLLPKIFELLKELYKFYLDNDMGEISQSIEESFGDMSMTSAEWIEKSAEEAGKIQMTFTGALMYLPSAVIFTTLAFFLFRCIAKRCGNWDKMRARFMNVGGVPIEAENNGNPYDNTKKPADPDEETNPEVKIMTTPLMIAVAIGVLLMFIYETLKLLPIAGK